MTQPPPSRQQAPAPSGAGVTAPEPGSEAPGAFIERYGLVQYTGRLGARYPREGACELGLCRTRRAEEVARWQQWQADAERQLADLADETRHLEARHAELLAWRPQIDSTRRRRRRELDANRRRRRAIAAEVEYLQTRTLTACEVAFANIEAQQASRGAMLVFDHCHRHGWVRGLICMACNNDLALFEPEPRSAWAASAAGALLTLVTAHLAKCPDCRRR